MVRYWRVALHYGYMTVLERHAPVADHIARALTAVAVPAAAVPGAAVPAPSSCCRRARPVLSLLPCLPRPLAAAVPAPSFPVPPCPFPAGPVSRGPRFLPASPPHGPESFEPDFSGPVPPALLPASAVADSDRTGPIGWSA